MLKRPVVILTAMWLSGAYVTLVDGQEWMLIGMSLLLLFFFAFAKRFQRSRVFLLLCAGCFIISMIYNHWFDSRNVSQLSASVRHIDLDGQHIALHGKIVTPVEWDGDRVSFVVQAGWVRVNGDHVELDAEKMQVFIRLNTEAETFQVQTWQRGDHITFRGVLKRPEQARNFDMFDYPTYLRHQHIHWIVNIDGLQEVVVQEAADWHWIRLWRWSDKVRNFLASKVDAIYSSMFSGYMKSLLIGFRDDLHPEQFQQFSQIGLTHIMAISGLHVGIFVAGCIWLFRLMGWTRETCLLITMFLIPFYIVFTGAAPSVVRAGFMAMIGLYALRRHVLKDGLNIISIVGVGMLFWNPYYLFNISFQLSFIVTLGIILTVPILMRLIPSSFKFMRATIAVTIAAQCFSFPLTIYYFNHFSWLSWLANLFLVPFISLVVIPLGMISMVCGLIFEPLGSWLAWIVDQCNVFTFGVVGWLNALRWFHTIWKSPSHVWIGLYFICLGLIFWCMTRSSSWRKFPVYLSLGSMFALLLLGYYPDLWDRTGTVQFIDVGQGDAILIRTPQGKHMLVDGGGNMRFHRSGEAWRSRKDPYDVGKDVIVPLLKKRGIHHLDYVLVTHGDYDHMGGLLAVLDQIPVKRILFNGTIKDAGHVKAFYEMALAKKIPLYKVYSGKPLQLDRYTTMTFLYPLERANIDYLDNQNHASVVGLLKMYDSTFLFTGDVLAKSEREIISMLPSLEENMRQIDVLKVAHHGSQSSTTEEWLEWWKPSISVISVGRFNSYGHPHPSVIERLRDNESIIYRTDHHGEIQMKVSPDALMIRKKLD